MIQFAADSALLAGIGAHRLVSAVEFIRQEDGSSRGKLISEGVHIPRDVVNAIALTR